MPLRRRKAPFLAMPLGKFESNVLGIRASLRGCGVSKNRGTPKSSILIGFSIMNHILDIYVRFQGGIWHYHVDSDMDGQCIHTRWAPTMVVNELPIFKDMYKGPITPLITIGSGPTNT